MHSAIYLLKIHLMWERFALTLQEIRQVKKMAENVALFNSIGFLRFRLSI